MKKPTSPQTLAKFIAYILERRPDEFGLVIDSKGYLKIKQLLKVLHEENGFKHVRRSHLDEILYTLSDPPFDILDNRIRIKNRGHLPQHDVARNLPKLLFTYIRRKAHPLVMDKGIFPSGYQQVVLSSRRELAQRMGKRVDPDPVILTVHVQKSLENGVVFYQAGELLFLAASIPPACFSGPALPKQKPANQKQEQTGRVERPATPGSFLIDPDKAGGKLKKKERSWNGQKKRAKKQKRKRERPPWRR